MADITLQVNTQSFSTLRLIDNVTGLEIPATLSNNQITSNTNPEFATFEIVPNNQVRRVGIATGAGTVVVSADAAYTDAGNGQQINQTFSVTKTFEVIGAPNGAHLELS